MAINIGIATSPFRESFQYAFDQEIPIVKENPSLEEMGIYDLIIFSGGADINPRLYGESITYSRGINNSRDEIEVDILSKALALGIKVFGVCRGHQLINAYLGGRLVQDLFMGQKPSLTHSSPHTLDKITSDRFLEGINTVNSLHHQGVISTGKDLQGTSKYKNVIESTIGKNIYSVQFHPEFMLESEEIKKFFRYFKNYVKNNERKKDPKTVSLSDIKNRPSIKGRAYPSIASITPGLESRIRATFNIEQFISFTKDFSDLAETNLELRIVPEHENILRNLYERKDRVNSNVNDLNNRDEEIYRMMEEDDFESDEEFEELEQERDEIRNRGDNLLNELSEINSTLIEYSRNIINLINRGGWSREGVEIPNNREEDSMPEQYTPRAQRVSFSEDEASSTTTVNSPDIDWSFITESNS